MSASRIILIMLAAVVGTLIGLPILDPIVGIVIAVAIVGITWNAARAVWLRMMDGVDPHLVEHVAAHALEVEGALEVLSLRLRWVGHRMYGAMVLRVDADSVERGAEVVAAIQQEARRIIPQLEELVVQVEG